MATYLAELWQVLLDLSPSLLLGLLIAGLIHVYLPAGLIHRSLSRPNLTSVARASLLGVPLPLCSCGVIPTALGLRRDGASRGATTAFMISTPQIGADSILVSAAFLGWPFAIFKVVAAIVTGLIGGALVNRLDRRTGAANDGSIAVDNAGLAPLTPPPPTSHRAEGLRGALRYGVFDLLAAIDLWLIAGILAAALITTLTPPDFFAGQVWATGLVGMLVVLAISLPLYVCTTASVPIAAALIVAGMPAGSAMVFLMAGPATNIATIGAVYRSLGLPVLSVYLGTVVVMSLAFGLTFDALLSPPGPSGAGTIIPPHVHGTDWLGTLSALVLLALLGWLMARRIRARWPAQSLAAVPAGPTGPGASGTPAAGGTALRVKGMTCGHCVTSVKRALESCADVDFAEPDLASGMVQVRGVFTDAAALVRAVEAAGFQVVEPPANTATR